MQGLGKIYDALRREMWKLYGVYADRETQAPGAEDGGRGWERYNQDREETHTGNIGFEE